MLQIAESSMIWWGLSIAAALALLAYRKPRNAVWGTASFGALVGLVVAVIRPGFGWGTIGRMFVIGTFIGLAFEWLPRIAPRRRSRAQLFAIVATAIELQQRKRSNLERAILQILGEGGLWMPSYIVGGLRDRFEPALIRPMLYDMHERGMIARHGEAFCLPESVDSIRTAHFKTLQSQHATGLFERSPEGRQRYEQIWRAVEDWDGFGESSSRLRHFKTIRLPRR
jgi:hypothetical protein